MDNEAKQIVTKDVDRVKTYLEEWLQRPDVGFGDHLDGKSNSKIRDEFKVCDN